MRNWLLASLLGCICWTDSAQAGLGLFRGRGNVISAVPGTYGPPAVGSYGMTPSAYAVLNSAAYPTGYVAAGTTYSRGDSTPVGPASGPELIDANPPVRPYSYYVGQPGTARGYYGYGEDQFPYYGRPYGHPYDPWTWPYMTDSYANSLHRYYSPPIP